MERHVLVTGGAGLIGNAVRCALEAQGRKVVAIDLVERTREGLPLVACDLTDIHRLHAIAAEYPLDAIIHCGAHSGPMVARDNPYSMVQVNVVGTANMLELARIHQLRRLVFCSSTSAYGDTPEGPVPEDVVLRPTSVYGGSKAASEALLWTYWRQFGVDALAIRLSWVYGPGRTTDCVIRTMIEDALAGRPTRLPFGQDFHRQFIHVEDAVAALLLALDAPSPARRIYTATGGTYVTLGEIGEVVKRVLPQADIALTAGPDPVDELHRRFDISAISRDLGYAPRFDLETGIRSYVDWIAARAG
ncbi:NAD(P)-dependent oxidoreductase [Ancylobacter aquaticus]|nr:NAD(P)-dependent oxidoreductase [Ancylobacter aquaticus]